MIDFVASNEALKVVAPHVRTTTATPPQLDVVGLLAFFSAFLVALVWSYRRESRPAAFTFSAGLMVLAVTTLMTGAWPMAFVAAAWSVVTAYEAIGKSRFKRFRRALRTTAFAYGHWDEESRTTRMFGSNRELMN